MSHVRAFSIHKGGVGKTALSVNVAGADAVQGARVLLVDFDPQGVATAWLVEDAADLEPAVPLAEALFSGQLPTTYTHDSGIDVWPATEDMFGVDRRLVGEPGRERVLARLVDQVSDRYDSIIIDCPPAFSPLHDAALYAAAAAVLPVWAERGSIRALETWILQRQLLAQAAGRAAEPLGLVMTQVDDSALTRELLPQLRDFPLPVLAELGNTKRLKAAQNAGRTIQQYAPRSSIADAIAQLAESITTSSQKPAHAAGERQVTP